MKLLKLVLINLYFLILADCKSKYYDGPDREYKFGYSIEGNQHRQEQKDANGIIMGEFGFITADGVYHVTGYGTDENGNFKILYMKNIKIGLPGEPGSKAAPTNLGGSVPAAASAVQRSEPVTKAMDISRPSASNVSSCSSCNIPKIEEPKRQLQPLAPASVTINHINSQKQDSGSVQQGKDSRPANKASSGNNLAGPNSLSGAISKQQKPTSNRNQIVSDGESDGFAGSPSFSGAPNENISPSRNAGVSNQRGSDIDLRNDNQIGRSGGVNQNQIGRSGGSSPNQIGKSGGFSDNQTPENRDYNLEDGEGDIDSRIDARERPRSGTSPSSGDATRKGAGLSRSGSSQSEGTAAKGSPQYSTGMSRLMAGLLYKFNYTVGYHGHNEQGDSAGAKDGGYYFVGRDGFKRVVDYTANEFGYQPHIKLETALPEDVPKEETEKEAGLKGYEFKWFNLDDKSRKRK